ncbi:MAG: hypothetical protein ABW252_24830 [Polyangiales bacterium]
MLVALALAVSAHAQPAPGPRTLTVVRAGSERGIVTLAQPGAACMAARCTYVLPAGTRVTLTAEAFLGGAFSGWGDTPGCGGIGACVVDLARDVTVTALFTGGPNVSFLSAAVVPAALGGVVAADAVCQAEARAAGLPGSYLAWLSTSTVDAPARLAGARGWVRPDGKPFADRVEDIVASRVYYPLRVDAWGRDLADGVSVLEAWTGTDRRGARGRDRTCGDWTRTALGESALGGAGTASAAWFSDAYTLTCDRRARLYCFGVGAVGEVVPRFERGRLAFATRLEFRPGGGIEAADRTCNDDARVAGWRGRFRALLATTTASAASRFDPGGARWVGVDGVPITARGDSLFAAVPFVLPPQRDAYGALVGGPVWTGARSLRDAGTRVETCDDWRGTTGAVGRGGSSTFSTAPYYLQDVSQRCDGSAQKLGIVCLEE